MKLPSLDHLRRLDADGLITVRPLGDLIICNYTPKCTYSGAWDAATIACRGLILRVDSPWPASTRITEIVALPFGKFFNVGEGDRWPTAEIAEVTEKIDGSLGILYRHDGQYRIATRGTFNSDQALWGTEHLKRFDLRHLPANLTLLFEIVYPGNRIVVDYGDREDLVLLGVRDRFSGRDWPHSFVRSTALEFGFTCVPIFHGHGGINHLLQRAKELDATMEGWVLRYADGTRWKIKGHTYTTVARLLNHATKKHVIEQMINGSIEEWLGQIPEEYRDEVLAWRKETEANLRAEIARLTTILADRPTTSRKDFALWVKTHHREDSSELFALLDGRDIRLMILKKLRDAG